MNFSADVLKTLRKEATNLGVELAALKAVVEVEGQAVDMEDGVQDGMVDGQVMIRWEGHYFWKLVPKSLQEEARRQGLADPRAGAVKNPRSMASRHRMLDRAIAIDRSAALQSISMGVGQVMGANYAMCRYPTVEDMWSDAQSLSGQVTMMARYIRAAGLADELQRLDWAGFARGYNGPNYKKYGYDTSMAAAYKRHGGTGQPYSPQSEIYRLGDPRVEDVRAIQTRLSELGYIVHPDGDYGTDTKAAVQLFQAEHDLKADGVFGPKTRDAMNVASPREVPEDRASATIDDVAKRSVIAKDGKAIRDVAIGGSTVIGGIKALEESGALEVVQEAGRVAGSVQTALGPIGAVLKFVGENWWVLAVVGGVVIAFWAHRVLKERLDDHRSGRTV